MSNSALIKHEVVSEIEKGLAMVPSLLSFTEKHLIYKPFIMRVLHKNLLVQTDIVLEAGEAAARGQDIEIFFDQYKTYDTLLTFSKAHHPKFKELEEITFKIFIDEVEPIAKLLATDKEFDTYEELVLNTYTSIEEALTSFDKYRDTLNEALQFIADNDDLIYFSRMCNDRILFILGEMNSYAQNLIHEKIAEYYLRAPAPAETVEAVCRV